MRYENNQSDLTTLKTEETVPFREKGPTESHPGIHGSEGNSHKAGSNMIIFMTSTKVFETDFMNWIRHWLWWFCCFRWRILLYGFFKVSFGWTFQNLFATTTSNIFISCTRLKSKTFGENSCGYVFGKLLFLLVPTKVIWAFCWIQ